MAAISKPIAILAAFGVIAAIYVVLQPDATASPVASRPKTPHPASKSDSAPPEFLAEDFTSRFTREKLATRNLFKAPTLSGKKLTAFGTGDIQQIPSELAGGDGNWIFTGVAILDGKKLALLENSNTHQGDYVTEGSTWKKSKVKRISGDGVALTSIEGGDECVVFRHHPDLLAKNSPPPPTAAPTLPPAGPIQPLNPQQLSGPIGGGMTIRRRRGRPVMVQSGGAD